MPSTKIDGFLERFPWVTKFAFRGEINQVYVQRVSPEIIGRNLENHFIAGEKIHHCDESGEWYETISKDVNLSEKIFLLDGDGKMVTKTYEKRIPIPGIPARRKYYFFGDMIPAVAPSSRKIFSYEQGCFKYGSTLNEKLNALLDVADQIKFVLSYWTQSKAVIVYKVPNGVTLPTWIKQQVESELVGFQKECEAIDAEAEVVNA